MRFSEIGWARRCRICRRCEHGGGRMNYTFQFQQLTPFLPEFLDGVWLTLRLTVAAAVLSLGVGVAGAVVRIYGHRAARAVLGAYVEVIRNTPFVVQIFLVFFALPSIGIRLSPNLAAVVALTINSGAYLVEIVRGGLLAIPAGQIDAANALNLPRRSILFDVILLPGLCSVYPAITSELTVLMLNTSICSIIAARELTSVANSIDAQTFRSFEVSFVLFAVYFGLSLAMSALFKLGARRFLSWEH
jgi:polar amino acid transport system permease protein